jgi:serine/threonine-protein kinase
MAPEQFSAPQKVDARTDVWALGATLFHLLTGTTPFHHEGVSTIHAMMHAVLYRPPMHPRALRPELPEELESVLLTCLEKDQAKRFESVAALAAALTPFGSEQAPIYSSRVARVLGVPEPGTHGPASRPDTIPLSAPDKSPLLPPWRPRPEPAPETHPPPLPPVAGTAPLPELHAPSTKRARLLIAFSIGAAACAAATIIALSARTSSEPPSTSETMPAARSLETPPPPVAGEASAALQIAVTDAPARIEGTAVPSSPRSVKPPPRRAGSTPASMPSATSAPKEDLYGRRR